MNRIGEDITFAQLRTFVCAANVGSFVKAADQLGISQPAVSEQITTLERRLGQSLFQRRRGTTPLLSTEGQMVLETAETILAASEDLFARKPPSVRQKVIVRICIGPLLRDAYLKPLLSSICREYPNVEIEFPPMVPLHEGVNRIEEGGLDLICYTVPVLPRGLPHVKKICDVPVCFVARPGTQERLRRGDVTYDSFDYFFPTGRCSLSEKWASGILQQVGVSLSRSVKFLDFGDALPDLVAEGHGIAYLMHETVADHVANRSLEILDWPLEPMQRIIARSPRAAPVVSAIGDLLCSAFEAKSAAANANHDLKDVVQK